MRRRKAKSSFRFVRDGQTYRAWRPHWTQLTPGNYWWFNPAVWDGTADPAYSVSDVARAQYIGQGSNDRPGWVMDIDMLSSYRQAVADDWHSAVLLRIDPV